MAEPTRDLEILQHELRSLDAVQATVGPVSEAIRTKARQRLDRIFRLFIELSPFLCIGSVGSDGSVDVSPRGDPPGFVKVLDDRTIVLPDRRGNRGLDTMSNVLETRSVGMIFFVPGIGEVLRLNGSARIVDANSPLLVNMDVRGTAPLSAMVITVHEVFIHCARAIARARLWEPDAQISRASFPTMGQIMREQEALDEETATAIDAISVRVVGEDLYNDISDEFDDIAG